MVKWDLAEWLERLAVYAKVATIVLGSIAASYDTVEAVKMKQCWITYIKKEKTLKKLPFIPAISTHFLCIFNFDWYNKEDPFPHFLKGQDHNKDSPTFFKGTVACKCSQIGLGQGF
jgi:hypothetical protein